MDDKIDLGEFTVHGQFILDLNLSGRLSADDAKALGQSLADAFSPSLAKLLKETSDLSGRREISVLCSGRVRRSNGAAPLPSYSVQCPALSASGWHEAEGYSVDGRFYGVSINS